MNQKGRSEQFHGLMVGGGLNFCAGVCLGCALKILILSDIHYPTGLSMACFDVIQREKPDIVVLLGDIVVGRGNQTIKNMREFLDEYPYPVEKSVILVGDNEFIGNRGILELLNGLPKLNPDPFMHVLGNMFFTHGNIEGRGPLSRLLEETGGIVARALKPLIPRIVSSLARIENGLNPRMYAFLGHIHFLGFVEPTQTVFCGTFSTKRMVYPPEESLGYVVVEPPESLIVERGAIRIVRFTQK